jgi:aconitate hydratase
MPLNIVEKILKSHLRVGEYRIGAEIGIRIDQTLTQDATGTMAYLQFEAMGLPAIQTGLSVSYVDHNTVQVGFENADDHRYLQTVAQHYGLVFSRPGNGICHQVHLERFGKPGTTLLGSDSHTPTGGGLGQIAIGAGGLDVAVAMGGGIFYLTAPKVQFVRLTGRLRPWVTAKDVVLHMLNLLTTKGNVGVVLEYGGPGVATLSVPQRATITNMGAEMGVTTSIFPSDEVTRGFFKAQQREQDWVELKADEGASYDRIIHLDLGLIEPLAACPHSPGNVKTVKELAGMKVDQVCIGSCTNSSLKDMRVTAGILKGGHVSENLSLGIAPGSRQVLQMLSRDGSLSGMLDAGARILESACGFCIGNHFSPKSARSGTKDAQVYLVSPEVAALSALAGVVVDPLASGRACPAVAEPDAFSIDDSMFIFPQAEARNTKIFRGPNIGEPPSNGPMPEALKGVVAIKVGGKITTDHIMPAGARLKYRSNVPKYAQYVFEQVDSTFPARCLQNRDKGIHNVIVAGESYGQGSSREHAAMCPMYLGVKTVVAKSFERIHAANLVNFGILPLLFVNPKDHDRIEAGAAVEAPDWRKCLEQGQPIQLRISGQEPVPCTYNLSGRQRKILLAGGLLNFTNPASAK